MGWRCSVSRRWPQVGGTEGFMQMDEGAVVSLLDDDVLSVSSEVATL